MTTSAMPAASVVALSPSGNVAVAPLAGTAKSTVTPGTALPYWSCTSTASGASKAVPTVASCPEPLTAVSEAGAPGSLVRSNDAGSWPRAAVTVYVPAIVLASTATVASPSAPVVTVAPSGNVAPAPLAGPLKATLTPGTGLPN